MRFPRGPQAHKEDGDITLRAAHFGGPIGSAVVGDFHDEGAGEQAMAAYGFLALRSRCSGLCSSGDTTPRIDPILKFLENL